MDFDVENSPLASVREVNLTEDVKRLTEEITTLKGQQRELIDIHSRKMVLSYAAGFFDGEGCIYIDVKSRNFLLGIELYNTDYHILIKLKSEFGGNIYIGNKDVENRKDSWQWKISNRTTIQTFLEKILPYSSVKRPQILLGLEYLKKITNSQGKKGLSSEEWKMREAYHDRMRDMKDVEYTEDEMRQFKDMLDKIKDDTTINHYNGKVSRSRTLGEY